MSALELLGPLLALAAGFRQFHNSEVNIWVDNAASVCIWEKGYSSSCDLSSSLVKAIYTVGASIGCRVNISKITRCSTPLAEMADALSKGAFLRCRALASQQRWNLPLEFPWVPPSLMEWVVAPADDERLGDRIVEDLGTVFPVMDVKF